jgi:hypothetical protein
MNRQWVTYPDEIDLFGATPVTYADVGICMLPTFDAQRNVVYHDASTDATPAPRGGGGSGSGGPPPPAPPPVRCVRGYYGFDPRVLRLELHVEYESRPAAARHAHAHSTTGARRVDEWSPMHHPLHVSFPDAVGGFAIDNAAAARTFVAVCGPSRAPHERSFGLFVPTAAASARPPMQPPTQPPVQPPLVHRCVGVVRRLIVHRLHLFANPRFDHVPDVCPRVYWDGAGQARLHAAGGRDPTRDDNEPMLI